MRSHLVVIVALAALAFAAQQQSVAVLGAPEAVPVPQSLSDETAAATVGAGILHALATTKCGYSNLDLSSMDNPYVGYTSSMSNGLSVVMNLCTPLRGSARCGYNNQNDIVMCAVDDGGSSYQVLARLPSNGILGEWTMIDASRPALGVQLHSKTGDQGYGITPAEVIWQFYCTQAGSNENFFSSMSQDMVGGIYTAVFKTPLACNG